MEHRAATLGSRVFIVLPGRRGHRSFHELNQAATRLANVLYALGLRSQERVAVLLPNDPDLLTALFGCTRLGLWAVLLDPAAGTPWLRRVLAHSRPKLLITSGAVLRRL